VLAQLGIHRALDEPLRQPGEQPIGARDLLRRARAGEQLIDQLFRKLRRLERLVSAPASIAGILLSGNSSGKAAFLSGRRPGLKSGPGTQRIGQTRVAAASSGR
jgi:hypothetical protein